MILYGDACSLIKLYIAEKGTTETVQCVAAAAFVGTSEITRLEIEATLARAQKSNRLAAAAAAAALGKFRSDWAS